MRSCLVQLQEKKGTRSPRLVALAFRGVRERLRRATGPKVTLHLAPFSSVARWSTARPGHLTSFAIGANSTETLLSNRTTEQV